MLRPPSVARWLALALTTAGCDRVTQAVEDKAEEVAESLAVADPTPQGPTLTEDEQAALKLELYAQCYRRSHLRMAQSWLRYTERIKDDGTPRNKNTPLFLYKIDSELRPCEEAAARGPELPPGMPGLEAAMTAYLDAGRRFAGFTVELDRYYEQAGYKQDAWARGKEVAPAFLAAHRDWSEASVRLHELLHSREDALERRLLAGVEQQHGRNLEWHARRSMIAARAFVRCATASPTDAEDPCASELEAIRSGAEALTAYREAHEAEARATFWLESFASSTRDYLEASERVLKAPPRGEARTKRLERLRRAYDDLAHDADNLRFDR